MASLMEGGVDILSPGISGGYLGIQQGQAIIGAVEKGIERQRKENIGRDIGALYAGSQQSGQPVAEEQIRDSYAKYGDTAGVERMNEKIYKRKFTKASNEANIALKQVEYALINKNFDAIQDITKRFNSDADNSEIFGEIIVDPNLGTIERNSIRGEQIRMPDGSITQGTGQERITLAKQKDQWVPVKVEDTAAKMAGVKEVVKAAVKAKDIEKMGILTKLKKNKATDSDIAPIRALGNVVSSINTYRNLLGEIPEDKMGATWVQLQGDPALSTAQKTKLRSAKDLVVMSVARLFEKGRMSDKDREFYSDVVGKIRAGKSSVAAALDTVENMVNSTIEYQTTLLSGYGVDKADLQEFIGEVKASAITPRGKGAPAGAQAGAGVVAPRNLPPTYTTKDGIVLDLNPADGKYYRRM